MNLATVPFVYQAQYAGAQRLIAMSYSHLLALGECVETKLDRLILLFNISRCGSTLLHQIFNRVPGVVSLSEPDGFVPFWSEETRLPADEAIALMKASAKFLFRSQAFPHLAVPAIKPLLFLPLPNPYFVRRRFSYGLSTIFVVSSMWVEYK